MVTIQPPTPSINTISTSRARRIPASNKTKLNGDLAEDKIPYMDWLN